MKYINLSGKHARGRSVVVDDEDYNYLSQWTWFVTKKGNGYPARTKHNKNKPDKTIFMHRIINKTPEGKQTDHINRNKLDNRKENLRTVNNTMNQINKGLQKNNVSGYPGVSKRPNGKWWARLYYNGKMFSLGCYEKIQDAVEARKVAEREVWAK